MEGEYSVFLVCCWPNRMELSLRMGFDSQVGGFN
jgi:hypothetical protein